RFRVYIRAMGASQVILALGLVAAMGYYHKQAMAQAKIMVAKVRGVQASYDMANFDHKLSEFFETHGGVPKDIPEHLAHEITTRTGRDILKDPWGQPYYFQGMDDGFVIRSAGPDKSMGTEDDLYIVRKGDYLESHLAWMRDARELTAPMEQMRKKEASVIKSILAKAMPQEDLAKLAQPNASTQPPAVNPADYPAIPEGDGAGAQPAPSAGDGSGAPSADGAPAAATQ
ncbi:MAG TPA: hypothetical protein VNI01_15125, partial [Elusimicrobiota bacterium]|nr:hypothetical protein [Elusimicrobiota bacterium]